MYLLAEPTCTRCSAALPLRALWSFARASDEVTPRDPWLGSSGLFQTKVGVACPRCATKFEVNQTRIRVVRALGWGISFLAVWLLGAWARRDNFALDPTLELAGVIALLVGMFALQRVSTPYLARIRPVVDEATVAFPLYSVYERRNDEHAKHNE